MTLRALATLPLLALAALAGPRPTCATSCHGKETTEFRDCVHAGQLGCADCHGGDPTEAVDKAKAHDPAKGYRGKIARAQVPQLCGGCHSDLARMHRFGLRTDQLALYAESAHGKALARGEASAAVCTDCHGAHRLFAANDPRAPTARRNQPETCERCHSDAATMAARGLPSDTVARFRESVHGQALLVDDVRGAPSCADCHGSHGAAPPGVEATVHACGQCHVATAAHFAAGPHASAEAMRCESCHADRNSPEFRRGGCTSCHGAHEVAKDTRALYEGDAVGRCGHCHRNDDRATALVRVVDEGRRELRAEMDATERRIRDAKSRGLFIEDERLYVIESERALVSLQPLVHSVDARAIARHLDESRKRQERAREALDRKLRVLRDRRIVLVGFAALILLFAWLLWAKLQAVRRPS